MLVVGVRQHATAAAARVLRNTFVQHTRTTHSRAAGETPTPRHFLTLRDFDAAQIRNFIQRAAAIKLAVRSAPKGSNTEGEPLPARRALEGKTLSMIFTKRSTRTRISSESGWAWFGGHPMFLGAGDIQLSGGEPLRDTAVVVSSMVDCILARVGAHSEITTLAKYSSVPVINALTAKYHPLQGLADILTLYETMLPSNAAKALRQTVPEIPKLTVAWVGDSNNVVNSLLASLPRLGPIHFKIVTPECFPMDKELLDFANKTKHRDAQIELCKTPEAAVNGANVIFTDTWVSMGQESEYRKRLEIFNGFQITEELCKHADSKWKFMHCLPRKNEEVEDAVFYNPDRSLVWKEAENRKYTVMSVYEWIMGI